MENNQTQFLESLLTQIRSLKEQVENLESLVAGHLPVAAVEEDLPEETVPEAEVPAVFGLEVDDEIVVVPLGEAHAATGAVMDRMAEKESWRTDIPGASVNDIRSAISLNDRILFINTLFHENPTSFKETLAALNAMPSFEEGVKFVLGEHPEWNTGSDVVYRFMMAVRRKLR